MYDYIIIGGGVSGLYLNYLLTKDNKTLLLEKNDYFGGRALDVKFHDSYIKLGAGIAELHNKHLLKVLKKLKIKTEKYDGSINVISNEKVNINKMITIIKKTYKKLSFDKIKNMSASEFIIKYCGQKFFDLYSKYVEYTDFFDSSIESYIKYYNINDHNQSDYVIVYVDWMLLIQKLIEYIKKYNKLKKNYEVKEIKFNIDTNTYIINNTYETKNIVFATTIKSLSNIIKKSSLPININYNDYIGYVPFIRIYTYHKNGHNINAPRYNIVNSKLHKVLLLNEKILMVSYSDNANALYWHKFMNNKKELIIKIKIYLKKLYDQDITIDDIMVAFWEEGVHYYKPKSGLKVKEIIKKLNNPHDNIYVCGEMLSLKQGWVEGAIQSADDIYRKLPNLSPP
jgi:protoporphyrinogen oxidase